MVKLHVSLNEGEKSCESAIEMSNGSLRDGVSGNIEYQGIDTRTHFRRVGKTNEKREKSNLIK